MRHLFGKEHKSAKLQKKLQKEEDERWEQDSRKRKEQEALDEAYAKELQAQLGIPTNPPLQAPSPTDSSPSTQTSPINLGTPPPLPAKPTEYSSVSFVSSSQASFTSSLTGDSNHTNIHSNASRQPTPSSSELNRPVPPPPYASSTRSSVPALPPRNNSSSNMSSISLHSTRTSFSVPMESHNHTPRTHSSPAPMQMSSSTPTTTSMDAQQSVGGPQHYFPSSENFPAPVSQQPYHLRDTPTGTSQQYIYPPRDTSATPGSQQQPPMQPNFSYREPAMLIIPPSKYTAPTHQPLSVSMPTVSMPQPSPVLRSTYSDTPTGIVPPSNPLQHAGSSTPMPVQRQSSTAPDKPNEVGHRPSNKPVLSNDDSDDDDYESMFFERRSGMVTPTPAKAVLVETIQKDKMDSVKEDEADPFADAFAVEGPEMEYPAPDIGSNKVEERRHSSSTLMDPTGMSMRARLEKLLQEQTPDFGDEKVQETNDDIPRHRPVMVVLPRSRSKSMTSLPLTLAQGTPLQSQTDIVALPNVVPVYPTRVLRAGAPPGLPTSTSQPNLVQATNSMNTEVPQNEYGYYDWNDTRSMSDASVNKILPPLPNVDEKHRHITVPSISDAQRVWIRVHPTDTGKTLARRIGIVATYNTRKITKITTATGRVLSLDDTPVFEDWADIEKLQQGVAWKIEWGPLDSHLTEMLEGSKDFMRHIKASLRSYS